LFFLVLYNSKRSKINNKNDVWILLDGGWTHPGWWSRECCMYVLNCTTGLPIARKYLMKGKNWDTKLSSKSMEPFAAKELAEELYAHNINVSHIVHDKDSSTLFHIKKIYPNIKELLCTDMYFT
jgi:hypothetical protein